MQFSIIYYRNLINKSLCNKNAPFKLKKLEYVQQSMYGKNKIAEDFKPTSIIGSTSSNKISVLINLS